MSKTDKTKNASKKSNKNKGIARFILKNIVAFIVLIIAVFAAVFFSLDKYTQHDTVYKVPDLYGMSEKKASVLIEKNNLRYRIIDSVHLKKVSPGAIVEQKPKAGAKAKSKRIVFLTINAIAGEVLPLPDVNDFSERQARVTLRAQGFNFNETEYVPSDFKGLVLYVKSMGKNVMPGDRLPKGSYLTLVVGQGGEDDNIIIPDLSGQTLDEAVEKLEILGLRKGNVFYDDSDKDKTGYIIYKQIPEKAEKSVFGQKVNLWLTTDSDKVVNTDNI